MRVGDGDDEKLEVVECEVVSTVSAVIHFRHRLVKLSVS